MKRGSEVTYADHWNQDEGVQSLRAQQVVLRQQILDSVLAPAKNVDSTPSSCTALGGFRASPAWQDRPPNKNVLGQACIPSIFFFALLSQRRLRWLGHVSRMEDGRIPKDLLYGELATGTRPVGRSVPRYKDVPKQDLKAGNINLSRCEAVAADRSSWRLAFKVGIQASETEKNSGKSTLLGRGFFPPLKRRKRNLCTDLLDAVQKFGRIN